MSLHPADLVVLGGYFLCMALMGLHFSRHNRDTERYFLGGRAFAGWIVGISLVGTSISSITFLAYPGDAFKTAWLRYLPNLMLPLAVVVAAYLFLPFLRRKGTTTAYEYLEARFGPSVRVYGAVAFIIAQLVRVSMILYLVSLVIQEISGLGSATCILVSGLVVALYTIMGGIEAVIWTDVIQTVVLLAGGIACLAVIDAQLTGGLMQVFTVAGEQGKFGLAESVHGELRPVGWHLSLGSKTATMMLLIGLTNWLTEYSSNQNTVQRFCAARSARDARRAMFVCAFVSLPVWAFFMFLGTALWVFFQQFPTPEAAAIAEGTRKAEEILPYFITHYLPPGVVGLVLAAALAAAMSSLDSSINSISTVTIVDLYRRHLARDQSERHYLIAAWWIAGASAAAMIGGALYLTGAETKTLQDTATILVSLLGGGLLGIYLIGFFTSAGDARHVWIGIAATMLFTAWTLASGAGLLPSALTFPFDLYYTGLIGNVIMFAVIFVGSLLLLPHKRDLADLTTAGT